jgi:hypothetical protein
VQVHKVPEVVVGCLGLRNLVVWLRLDSVNEIWELDSILNEEHRDVIANNVPVAFIGVELDSESTDIADCISATSASLDS